MNKNAIRFIAVGLLAAVVGGVILVQVLRSREGDTAKAQGPKVEFRAKVVVQKIIQKEVQPVQKVVGTVMPTRVSKVGSAASGRVEKFLKNEGEPVDKDEPIAQLKLGIIQAEVNAAAKSTEAHKAQYDYLKKSTVEEIDQAIYGLAKKHAWLEYIFSKKERVWKLDKSVSQEEKEEANSLLKQAKNSWSEGESTLYMLISEPAIGKLFQKAGQPMTKTESVLLQLISDAGPEVWKSSKKYHDPEGDDTPRAAKIKEARAKWEAAEAEQNRLEEQLKRHTIKAPFSGYVTREYTEAGEWVLQGALVAEIAELKEVDIEVPVLEDFIRFFTIGEPVSVEIPALPGQKFEGKVEYINPQANLKTRTFPVKIRVPNQPHGKSVLIKAGMLARVEVPTASIQDALLVPRDSLVLGGKDKVIYVIDPDPKDETGTKGTARAVKVDLGPASEDKMVQILAPVKEGDWVVIQGNERLHPGQPVVMKKSE